ncbi:MAG: hypothetical protein RL562_1383 [Planctomycetota bacterium]
MGLRILPGRGTGIAPLRVTMRCVLAILMTVSLCGSSAAQGIRLVDRAASPLAYVSVDAAAGAAEPGRSGLDILLDDPTIRFLMAAQRGAEDDPGLLALNRVRDLGRLSTGELELALQGLLPRGDAPAQPLMLARVRLSEDGRDRLESALRDPAVASPGRRIGRGNFQVYGFGAAPRSAGPGSRFDVCLVGSDLLFTNHLSSLEELFEGDFADGPVTGSGAPAEGAATGLPTGKNPESLAADASFSALRERLEVGPGAAFVHLDWRRLRDRATSGMDEDRLLVLEGAGLLGAERIAMSLRPVGDQLHTTMVMDQPEGVSGLLAVARPAPIKRLVQDLPGHGVASLAFSIEPDRLRRLPDVRHAAFHAGLVGLAHDLGVDFDEDILPLLGAGGAFQIVLLDEAGEESAVALSFRARSSSAARALVTRVRDGLEKDGHPDRDHDHRRSRGWRRPAYAVRGDVLVFGSEDSRVSFGAVGESVVVGMHEDAVERVAHADRGARRNRARHQSTVQERIERLLALHEIDEKAIVGVFDIEGATPGEGEGPTPSKEAGHHVGVLLLEGRALRLELLSER